MRNNQVGVVGPIGGAQKISNFPFSNFKWQWAGWTGLFYVARCAGLGDRDLFFGPRADARGYNILPPAEAISQQSVVIQRSSQ